MKLGWKWLSRGCWIAAVLTALLLLANLPFYAGGSLGRIAHIRMEHGRVTVHTMPAGNPESFFIDLNSEGLRWSFDLGHRGGASFVITVPLWFIAACFVSAALASRRVARASTPPRCSTCGYPRDGLGGAPCPECGTPSPPGTAGARPRPNLGNLHPRAASKPGSRP